MLMEAHPSTLSSPAFAALGESSSVYYLAGRKCNAAELMQYRCPVVSRGPSGKTWPRCDPQRLHSTSSRTMPWERSSTTSTLVRFTGSSKLGHPQLESNLASDEKSGCPQATHSYIPLSWLFQKAPVKGRSVPFKRHI